MNTTFSEKSSFTADGVAYRRIFTNIPLAREIWDIYKSTKEIPNAEELKRMQNRTMLSFFEGRYLLTNRELERSGIKQILELAPGLSSRGITMTASPDVTYVEFDLKDKMASKKHVASELIAKGKISEAPNLYFESGNVINIEDFRRAAAHLDQSKPIAVICEGLLRYISLDDKKILGKEIHDLLVRSGGMWITPDAEFLSEVEKSAEQTAQYNKTAKSMGFDVRPNIFRDEAHALQFFSELGFTVEKYPASEAIPLLASPQKAGLTPEEVERPLKNRWLYVMRVK